MFILWIYHLVKILVKISHDVSLFQTNEGLYGLNINILLIYFSVCLQSSIILIACTFCVYVYSFVLGFCKVCLFWGACCFNRYLAKFIF